MTEVDFTFIKSDKKLIKLDFDEISLIKGLGNYVEIFTSENRKFVYYKSLKELIEKLPEGFMRVHNSFIVNIKNVRYFEGNELTVDTHKITVAKSYKECLLRRINKLLL